MDYQQIIMHTIKNQGGKACAPFLFFILYSIVGLVIHKNNVLIILYGSLFSIFIIASYAVAASIVLFNYKYGFIKELLFLVLKNFAEIFSYGIWGFYVYLVFYRGLWSLSHLRYGFSFYPFINLLLFTGYGFIGFRGLTHYMNVGDMIFKRKDQTIILQYVYKYKLLKE
jgi:hypothetical protein